jgi:hypothetical protein
MPYANYYLEPFKAAARSFAVEETIAPVRDGGELESVIAAQASARDGGFVVMPDSFTDTYRKPVWLSPGRGDCCLHRRRGTRRQGHDDNHSHRLPHRQRSGLARPCPHLNRPGESITGVSWFGTDLVPKQLSLLHELVPQAAVIALLVDLNLPAAESQASEVQAAARTLGLQLVVLNARTAGDIDMAFASLVRERASALLVGAGAFFVSRCK